MTQPGEGAAQDEPEEGARAPDLLLGPGFLGSWRRPTGLIEEWRVTHDDLRCNEADIFAMLAGMAAHTPPGGVLAGYVGYEAAASLDPTGFLRGTMKPPTEHRGGAMPLVWAGLFDACEPASPPLGEPAGPAERPRRIEFGPGDLGYSCWSTEDARSIHERMVAMTIESILNGELFQANLSRPLSAEWEDAPKARTLFGRLCAGTDAPYAALIDIAEGAVLSASPELFLATEGRSVVAEPIKGTRPRGATPEEDAGLAADLEASHKDRAENVMIADLMRNDLSRVALDGSIREEAVCALRTLPNVHHLYSRISATMRAGLGPFDALAAAFPCGSITGAPKLAAMRHIEMAEYRQTGGGRGPYCGTIFAVTPERAVFSVPIRTGVLTRGIEGSARLDVRVGGGVTALSAPAQEWAETCDKAYPFTLMTGLQP